MVLGTFAALSMLLAVVPVSALAATSGSIQKELDSVAAAYGKLETQLAQTEASEAKLQQQRLEADKIIDAKAIALQKRAGYMYKQGGATSLMGQLLTAPNLSVFVKRAYYLSVLTSGDAELVEDLTLTQARSDAIAAELTATETRQRAVGAQLKSKRADLQKRYRELKSAEDATRREAQAKLKAGKIASEAKRRQLEAAAKGETSAKVRQTGKFSSFTLPIKGPVGFADTWGAPRSGGRRHQGTDVMAPCGAPVVAVTEGAIQRVSSGGNGGISAYVRAGNGDVFFYAHLQSIASGVSAGKRVTPGDLIGYNGNSGNARGGPCHVHFEWQPGGGRPVNPYALLASSR